MILKYFSERFCLHPDMKQVNIPQDAKQLPVNNAQRQTYFSVIFPCLTMTFR